MQYKLFVLNTKEFANDKLGETWKEVIVTQLKTSLQDFEETNKGTVNDGEDGWRSVGTIV